MVEAAALRRTDGGDDGFGALKTLESCPVCHVAGDRSERIAEDFVVALNRKLYYTVDLCPICGLIYSRTRSVDDRLYSPELDLEKEHGHQRSDLPALSPEVWNFQTKTMQVNEILGLAENRDELSYLEVGSSDGTLFRMFRESYLRNANHLEAVLIESTGASARCSSIEGCTVVSRSFLDPIELSHESVDVAVLSHCLEHFDNPAEVVGKAARLLRPGGYLYIEVPDGMRYDRCISPPLGYYHVINFNLHNLEWLAQSGGLEIVKSEERKHYPGLRVIARREDGAAKPVFSEVSMRRSQDAIRQWRAAEREAVLRIQSALDDAGDKPVALYGAGVHALAIFRHFPGLLDNAVCHLADSNPGLKTILGKKVYSVAELDFSLYGGVIVSSYAYQEEIAENLYKAGCPIEKITKLYDSVFSYVS
ncbi:MAG: class I SAM-dependent methyltransferase [Rhodospirillales bacterium]|nr:class I SAM-dependent methyltransferase [Rhodospirillales bacterium]